MANVGKVCCVCKEEKQHSEFYKNKHKPLGFTYECKECVKTRSLPDVNFAKGNNLL